MLSIRQLDQLPALLLLMLRLLFQLVLAQTPMVLSRPHIVMALRLHTSIILMELLPPLSPTGMSLCIILTPMYRSLLGQMEL